MDFDVPSIVALLFGSGGIAQLLLLPKRVNSIERKIDAQKKSIEEKIDALDEKVEKLERTWGQLRKLLDPEARATPSEEQEPARPRRSTPARGTRRRTPFPPPDETNGD